jgi:hypothetical protein
VEITFEPRFRGPLTSANGGYACGRLAAFVDADAVEVTLRLPPPLDRSLTVHTSGERVVLLDGDAVVAEARPAHLELDVPPPVSAAAAEEARTRHVRNVPAVFAVASRVASVTTATAWKSTSVRSPDASRCMRPR